MKTDSSLIAPAKFSIVVTNLKNKRVKTWYIGGGFFEVDRELVNGVLILIRESICRMQSASNNGNKERRPRASKSKK